jgi:hypothetical protein
MKRSSFHKCFFRKMSWIASLKFMYIYILFIYLGPVRIRVRIDPSHPLVCRKRRMNGVIRKNRGPVSQQVLHNKDPSLLKALSAEHRPKFCSPSPVMVTSTYKRKILESDHRNLNFNQ